MKPARFERGVVTAMWVTAVLGVVAVVTREPLVLTAPLMVVAVVVTLWALIRLTLEAWGDR